MSIINRPQRRALGWTAAFIATIFGANWTLTTFGVVPIGFGLVAPAGVYFAGLAFTFRDFLHEVGGRWWVLSAILAGGAVSWYLDPTFAVASAAAFSTSELADYAVYAPLRRRGWIRAVAVSNIVGLVVDSMLFLLLAFGSLEFLDGQLVGKGYMTLAAIAALSVLRRYGALPIRRG